MSLKQTVLDDLNSLIATVTAVPEDGSTADLEAQVADLTSKLAAASQALSDDDVKVASEVSKEAALQSKIDAAKSALA